MEIGDGKNQKNSTVTLIIGIICGVLIVGITFIAIILAGNSKKDDKNKNDDNSSARLTQTSAVSTEIPQTQPTEPSTQKDVQSPDAAPVTKSKQYDMNIFMSNFSESDLPNFSMGKRLSAEELTWFARDYCFFNRYELYEDTDYEFPDGGYGNIRIQEKYIKDTVENYFGFSLDDSEFTENLMYHDGCFYRQVTGGDMSSGCTIVNKFEKIGDNTYKLYCDVYFTSGADGDYYSFNAQQAEEESKKDDVCFVKTKSGTAIIEAADINDRSTYILKEYQMQKV